MPRQPKRPSPRKSAHVVARRAVGAALVLGATLGAWPGSRPVHAEDKLVLRRGPAGARMTIAGDVIDSTGVEVSIRTAAGEAPRVFPAADVVEIQTAQTAAQTHGNELLADGRADEAIAELETALKEETRAWVRREILASLVRAGLWRGDYAFAGRRFLTIVRSDPATQHFRLIPLVWAPESLSPETRAEARGWMAGPVEAGQLLGASLLYDDPESGREARTLLKTLASSADARVRWMAQMQSWRDVAYGGRSGKLDTAHWQRRLDELPDELRAGPSYLLGRAYAARHDYELAAASLLWLPLVDDHDHRLAARACLEAGLALARIGQQAEARTLFDEVATRFAGTPAADEAAALEESTAAKTGKSK